MKKENNISMWRNPLSGKIMIDKDPRIDLSDECWYCERGGEGRNINNEFMCNDCAKNHMEIFSNKFNLKS